MRDILGLRPIIYGHNLRKFGSLKNIRSDTEYGQEEVDLDIEKDQN